MEERSEHIAMLDLMLRPAFTVKDGIICHVNQAAQVFCLSPGDPVMPLILYGQEEYGSFSGGNLSLTLSIADRQIPASVERLDDHDLFLPEPAERSAEMQALALAAMELREPLAGLMAATERVFASAKDTESLLQAQANQRLYQMLRIVGNMSDAVHYTRANGASMEYVEICSFLEEILEKNRHLLSLAGYPLQIHLPSEAIYTLADREKLERAINNLLSNAAKHGPQGSPIQVQLTRKKDRLQLSITDAGDGPSSGNLYRRFLRQPTLEDPRLGIGLGMVLVRSVAAQHGGTVLVDQPKSGGNRVTLTLSIRQSKSIHVRTPILRIDYAGERDHGLLELSDVLPAELYLPQKL